MDDLERFNIIVDAMGGDFAPDEIIEGAIEAIDKSNARVILVGDKGTIESRASANGYNLDGIEIVHSSQLVSMNESPSEVIKKKKDSSIYIGSKMVSAGKGGAFLSAGNTGAVMACSLLNMKRIEGILRPAIAAVIPLSTGKFVLIDAGANADCKPQFLMQFALMGKIYCQNILGIKDPKVALNNIGGEEKKGNELSVESYKLLSDNNRINFIGNIEGRDMFDGRADVVVADGFTGNVILKSIEGIAKMFFGEIKEVLNTSILSKLAALGLKKSLLKMKKKFDYEEYGGAQLLGLNGIVIISHGSSKAKAIGNAIKVALEGLKNDLVNKIAEEVKN